jgi:hypothetical protein
MNRVKGEDYGLKESHPEQTQEKDTEKPGTNTSIRIQGNGRQR